MLQAMDTRLAQVRRQLESNATESQFSPSRKSPKSPLGLELSLLLDTSTLQFEQKQQLKREQLELRERKRLEAEELEEGGRRMGGKQWPGTSARLAFRFVGSRICQALCCLAKRRRRQLEAEKECEINVYYLLYLLHLRLGRSRSRTEEVIRMTARALENYLSEHEQSQQEARQRLIALQQQQQHSKQAFHGEENSSDHSSTSADHPQPIISESVANDDAKLVI
jgi:hypothetical protein